MELVVKEKILDILKSLPEEEKSQRVVCKIYSIINAFPAETSVEKVIRCKDCGYLSHHIDRRYGKVGVIHQCVLKDEAVADLDGYCHYAEPIDEKRYHV